LSLFERPFFNSIPSKISLSKGANNFLGLGIAQKSFVLLLNGLIVTLLFNIVWCPFIISILDETKIIAAFFAFWEAFVKPFRVVK